MKIKNLLFITALFLILSKSSNGQPRHQTPPMGFMTWNYFADKLTEADVKSLADVMSQHGWVDKGYQYIFIDDGWQGGRDSHNNIIADPIKFPSGMKALADYVHNKGLKLGIYSDAAPLTCAGYTGSLHFEDQDARTFASWGIDYLKYDYCGAPQDQQTAETRYKKMSDALNASGRLIEFGICEWGDRSPWLWAAKAGGLIWRTTADIRDKWAAVNPDNRPLGEVGAGILDVVNINGALNDYAGPGHFNDPDMLVVGLNGKKGPSGDLGGIGCTDQEYQSQMSLWCLMSAPLMISCDLRNLSPKANEILGNKKIIAIDQDALALQAVRKIKNDRFQVFVKPLANNQYAIGILNTSSTTQKISLTLQELGLSGSYQMEDLWRGKIKKANNIKEIIESHETLVLRLNK